MYRQPSTGPEEAADGGVQALRHLCETTRS